MMTPMHHQAEDWAARAQQCRMSLTALHAPTEQALLELGDRLRQAHGTSRNLSVMAHALTHRLAEAEFQKTLGELDGTVRLVRQIREEKSDRGARLRNIAVAAEAIRTCLASLTQAMGQVKVLGVNAKIEAAQMSVAGVDFSLFTHEIVRLAERGRHSLEDVARERAQLVTAASEAESLQRAFEERHLRQLTEVGDRLEASLSAMQGRERAASAALGRLPKVLEQATARIGDVVGGLQFGDISRQRLEHVETALDVLARVSTGEQPLPDIEGASLPVFVAAVCELQGRQLAHVDEEFAGRVATVLDNLRSLVGAIAEIGRETRSVYSADGGGGTSSTFLMAIDEELERVAAAIDYYKTATAQTEASLGAVTAAAGRMAESMRAIGEIDADMNLIGLNASLKCGNLGSKGRALNVIAQELRSFAKQTRNHAAAIEDGLRTMRAAAAAITASGNDAQGQRLESLGRYLDSAIADLRQSGGETAWVLSQIQEQSQNVAAAMDGALAQFDAHRAYADTVAAVRRRLDELSAAATAGIPPQDLQAAKQRMLAFMEQHYTMDSERHIHGAVTGAVAHSAAPEAEPDLSDIFF